MGKENVGASAAPAYSTVAGKGANAFNPYMRERLPNVRGHSVAGAQMLQQMGASVQRIEKEATHRTHWRQELYPVVFGDPKAPHEILVLLDFASPQSEAVWQAVVEAGRSLTPAQAKIVVFGKNREIYGTDLMGLAIWLTYSRQGQAMPFLSHALSRWNAVKAGQKRARGSAAPFRNEYDATVHASDYPIHYEYLKKLRPPVPLYDEADLSRQFYDAGNVNMYQAMQISVYYNVSALPAVIVDGRVLASVSARTVLDGLR
jgi:hypothetical protein